MASIIKTDNIQKVSDDSNIIKKCGSTITIGSSGASVALASGATQTGFGRTGTVDWCTTAKTAPFTAVSGDGYFVNTTSGAVTVTLPASPSAGDIIAVADYASTWNTNNLTLCRNSSKINGTCQNAILSTEGASVTMVYVDGTRGWKQVNDGTLNVTGQPAYVTATGGTVTTCGDFKIHTFNSDATFCVSAGGLPSGSNTVEYLVVAGGGGGGSPGTRGGGGGGGGYRFASCFSVTAQGYPITIGSGGAVGDGTPTSMTPSTVAPNCGSNSVFSTITSAGGGRGGIGGFSTPGTVCGHGGGDGGSGGGGGTGCAQQGPVGTGNTPPVSPPQGNNGGLGAPGPQNNAGGGGGGAGAVGTASPSSGVGGAGGAGSNASPIDSTLRAGGGGARGNTTDGLGGPGGGGDAPAGAGTVNTGGGGAGGGAGGSGIVILRYKFQN